MSSSTAPTVLLLHGAGQSASVWDGVIEALGDSVEARAVAMASQGRFTVDDAVAAVTANLATVRGPVVLVGLSLGAMIAARRAAALIPQAQLQVIPGVGHTWNETHPALFADTVRHVATS